MTDDELIDRANRALAYGVPRTCDWCGEPFRVADFHPAQQTCSRACQMARYNAGMGHVPMGTAVTGTCTVCTQRFTYQSRKRPRIYCDTCRPTSHHKRK
jgi:hypothetical protein